MGMHRIEVKATDNVQQWSVTNVWIVRTY